MFESLQSIATLAATGTGIYVALNGLRSWKREHTGKRDIELCQKVIETFYEAEQKVAELRSPLAYPSVESAERPKDGLETEEDARRRDQYYVPIARYLKQREFWVGFHALKYRMRALFGEAALAPYNEVDGVVREFRAAASTRYETMYRSGQIDGGLTTTLREWERMLWDSGIEEDATRLRLKSAIADMEAICIPIVRAVHTPPFQTKFRGLLRRRTATKAAKD